MDRPLDILVFRLLGNEGTIVETLDKIVA